MGFFKHIAKLDQRRGPAAHHGELAAEERGEGVAQVAARRRDELPLEGRAGRAARIQAKCQKCTELSFKCACDSGQACQLVNLVSSNHPSQPLSKRERRF